MASPGTDPPRSSEGRARTRRPLLAPYLPPPPPPRIQDPELDAMRAEDRARDLELHPFSDLNKRRWKMYVIGAMVYFPLVTCIFTSAGFGALWFQLIVAALYGSYLAFARPSGIPAALGALLAGVLTQAVVGLPRTKGAGLAFVLGLFMYACGGLLVGVTERSKILNGE